MKAVRFHTLGGPDVLHYEDAPRPVAGPGQVLVRVAATAFSQADAGIRGGTLPFPVTLPHTPGYDVSGTVEEIGAAADGAAPTLTVGDSVIGFLPMTEDGSAAEFVVAPADALVAAPTSSPLADAAALPSVGLTAWQALFDEAGLSGGQRILITGAGGAVGGYAVRLASRARAHVIATASPRSHASLARNGAAEIIDHTASDLLEAVTEPVDVLLNLAPYTPEEFDSLVPLVRDGGIVVSTTAWMPTPGDDSRGVRSATVFLHADRDQLQQLVALVDAGELTVDVSERVALSELPAVHARAAAGTLRGKVVALPEGAESQSL